MTADLHQLSNFFKKSHGSRDIKKSHYIQGSIKLVWKFLKKTTKSISFETYRPNHMVQDPFPTSYTLLQPFLVYQAYMPLTYPGHSNQAAFQPSFSFPQTNALWKCPLIQLEPPFSFFLPPWPLDWPFLLHSASAKVS